MRTFGFGAAGRAGKASESLVFAGGCLVVVEEGAAARVMEAVVVGEGREADDDGVGAAEVPQTVVEPGPEGLEVLLPPVEAERGGNGLLEEAFRPTAEREDCAVDDFNRNTRFPPAPAPLTVLGDMPGRTPLGPGSAG